MGIFGIIGVVVLVMIAVSQSKNNRRQIGQRQDPSKFIGVNYSPDLNRFSQQPGFQNNNYAEPIFNPDQPDDLTIDNGMGKATRYLQSNNLRSLKISNGLGTCTVYYDQVCIPPNGSSLRIENGMGVVNVYIPPFYRLRLNQNSGLGSVELYGNPSMDPSVPLIDCFVENGLGKVKIHFQ